MKYLGNTVIESARSEEATAEAVKAIISTAKGNKIYQFNKKNEKHFYKNITQQTNVILFHFNLFIYSNWQKITTR